MTNTRRLLLAACVALFACPLPAAAAAPQDPLDAEIAGRAAAAYYGAPPTLHADAEAALASLLR